MEDEARFEPGVADALKEAFMKEGTVDHRSITIERICSFPHGDLDIEELCPECGDPEEELTCGKADWVYQDDKRTWFAVEIFLALGGKLKMRMPGEFDGRCSPETDFNNETD